MDSELMSPGMKKAVGKGRGYGDGGWRGIGKEGSSKQAGS